MPHAVKTNTTEYKKNDNTVQMPQNRFSISLSQVHGNQHIFLAKVVNLRAGNV